MLSSAHYYGVYHGHDVTHLGRVFHKLVHSQRSLGKDVRVVWLAGDSSLDNKYWLDGPESRVPACNGMERVLQPPTSVADIATHLNSLMESTRSSSSLSPPSPPHYVCINCSVEESTIGIRNKGRALLPQDQFLKDHLIPGDVVVVSLGGNDIALKPNASTILSMGWLTSCSRQRNVVKGTAWGLGSLQSLVVGDLSLYLSNILSPLRAEDNHRQQSIGATTSPQSAVSHATRKSIVLPCVIYYPDENAEAQSWANMTLAAIGYNKAPQKVQGIIDRIATVAAEKISAQSLGFANDAVHVEVVPLSRALDGKRSEDYVARVEPSVFGGRRMAELIWGTIMGATATAAPHASLSPSPR
jgi:hypothetical protein